MNKLLFLFLSLIGFFAKAQHYKIITAFPETNAGAYVTCVTEDSVNNYIYIAGTFTSLNGNNNYKYLARVDASTYAIDPTFTPISSIDGKINHMVVAGSYLYVGGDFQNLNNQTNSSLIRILLTSKSIDIYWNELSNKTIPVSGLITNNNYIYFSVNDFGLLWAPIYLNGNSEIHSIARFDYQGKLDTTFSLFNPYSYNITRLFKQNDSTLLFNGFEQSSQKHKTLTVNINSKVISSTCTNVVTCGSSNYFSDRNEDVIRMNNKIYSIRTRDTSNACGTHQYGFFINTLSVNNCTETIKNPVSNSATTPKSISIYNNKLFIAGLDKTGNKKFLTSYNPQTDDFTNTFYPKIDSNLFGFRSIWVFKNRLYITDSTFTKIDNVNKRGIAVLCLAPELNTSFTAFEDTVCQKQNDVLYRLNSPALNRMSYKYSYTGGGVTFKDTLGNILNGSFTHNAFKLNFNVYATSGTLFIYPQTDCGTNADTLSLYIHVKENTIAYAGLDTSISCYLPSIDIYGQSSQKNVSYQWKGPDSSYVDLDSIASGISIPGSYTLTVYTNNGCSNFDIVKVFNDTTRSNILLPKTLGAITCKDSLIPFSGYSDTLSFYSWHENGIEISNTNQLVANTPGNYYFLAQNQRNGCIDSSLVQVIVNKTPPANIFANIANYNPALPIDSLNCIKDSVTINLIQSSSSAFYKYIWTDTNNTVLSNFHSQSFTIGGKYLIWVTDTVGGCKNIIPITILEDYNKPIVTTSFAHSPSFLSCSIDSIYVNGIINVSNGSFSWLQPGGSIFNGTQIIIKDTGTYVVTGKNNYNGCTNNDTIHIPFYPELTVNINATKQKVCKGALVELNASVDSYNLPVTYSWDAGPNSSAINVFPIQTSSYIVFASGSNGCYGSDTITIEVNTPFEDSIVTYAPCDLQTSEGAILIYLSGGTPPYQYALNNTNYQSSFEFENLDLGNYIVNIIDSIGCTGTYSVSIDSASTKPSVMFLSSTLNQTKDTIALVDVSIPQPDSISWHFPSKAVVIDSSINAPIITINDTGSFIITMEAFYSSCKMYYQKNIQFGNPDTNKANNQNENGIESVVILPNPNNGVFTIEVKLYKQQNFVVILANTLGNEVYTYKFENSALCQLPFNLNNAISGTWILKVIAEYDARHEYIIINK